MGDFHVSRARTIRKAALAALTLTVVAVGTVGPEHAATADAPPQRVLQAVNVDLGSDGTLYGIKGVTVRKTDGAKPTTSKQSFDPSKTATQLPVRILTSYRTASRSGTDLRDLKGYTGKVQLDVTVQNTTVRPEQLSYDSDGASRSASALVGVPLTVVASTNLGQDTVDRVVTRSDSGAATNGVLAQDKNGDAVVQWASILAPPQLAPSTTFTLVMNAKDFALPSFDLSVQPGLAADSSMRSLLDEAFGPDGNEQLQLQSQTIQLIGQVTGVLARAGDQLVDVRKQLRFSAGTLGDQTIADLTSGTEQVSSSTRALAGSLQDLGDRLGVALQSSKSQTVSALKDSVDRVSKVLGDPNAAVAPAALSGAGCTRAVADLKPSTTVAGQLAQVTSLLQGLSQAPADCATAIQQSLVSSVGQVDTHGAVVCSSGTTSALCQIEGAQASIENIKNGLGTDLANASKDIAGLKVGDAQDALDQLRSDVSLLQTDIKGLNAGGSNVATDLDAVAQAIQDLQDGSLPDVKAELVHFHQVAGDRLQDLGASTDDVSKKTAYGYLNDLTSKISPADPNAADLASDALALRTSLDGQVSAWKDVLGATDPTTDTYKAVAAVSTDLAALADKVSKAQHDASGNTGGLDTLIKALQAKSLTLSADPVTLVDHQPVSVDLTSCANAEVKLEDPDPMSVVRQALLFVQCKQDGVSTALQNKVDAYKATLTAQQAAIEAQVKQIDAQRQVSSKQVSDLFAEATRGLTAAGASVQSSTKTTVDNANADLASGEQAADQQLSGLVSRALKGINAGVGSSTRDLQAAADLLSKDLAAVLADLGSKDKKGSGLLGTVQAQVAQTRTSGDHVAAAGDTASSFGNVRSQDLDGIFLQNAQLAAAVERQSQQEPFAISLPNGSQHVTVFTFHMREVK